MSKVFHKSKRDVGNTVSSEVLIQDCKLIIKQFKWFKQFKRFKQLKLLKLLKLFKVLKQFKLFKLFKQWVCLLQQTYHTINRCAEAIRAVAVAVITALGIENGDLFFEVDYSDYQDETSTAMQMMICLYKFECTTYL